MHECQKCSVIMHPGCQYHCINRLFYSFSLSLALAVIVTPAWKERTPSLRIFSLRLMVASFSSSACFPQRDLNFIWDQSWRKGQHYPAVLPPRTCKLLLWRKSTVVCLVFTKEHSHPSPGPDTDSWDLLQFVHGTAALPLHGHLLSDFLQRVPLGHDTIYTLNSFKLAPFSFKAQTIDVVTMSMVFIGRLTNLELTCIHVTSTDYGCGRPILLLHGAQLRTTPALITGSKSVHQHQKIATRYRL